MDIIMTLWPILQHYVFGVLGLTGGLLFWKFSPAGKSIGLIVAVVTALVVGGYTIGVKDGEDRVRAIDAIQLSRLSQEIAAAQRDADQSIPQLVPDAVAPSPAPAPRGLQHPQRAHKPLDKFDRG